MIIKSIWASNFKSLVDFRLELTQFNCLIGLNGSGKSTVLQLIDFISQLVRGNMEGWLRERKWKSSDLKSKMTRKMNIDFRVDFTDKYTQEAGYWAASYSPAKYFCTRERFELGTSFLEVKDRKIHVVYPPDEQNRNGKPYDIKFDYEGSILSAWKDNETPKLILSCKRFLEEIKSLDLLSPEYLRQRTRESSGSLGLGGQNLPAFLSELGLDRWRELGEKLKMVYPQLQTLTIKPLRSGWKQLEITENIKVEGESHLGFFPQITTEARHINDGMLRLIAILAELQSDHRFLLFDEIENGVNPELVEFLIEMLTTTDKQVLVTTHSPIILNYLSDEDAKCGVIYLYKTPDGYTKSIPFFSIPSMAEKLTVMGPGEVFVDTNLIDLAEEIQTLDAVGL